MGVSPGERYGTSVIDFGYEACGDKPVRLSEGGGDDVGRGRGYGLGLDVRGGRGANGKEMTGGILEREDHVKRVILSSRDFSC